MRRREIARGIFVAPVEHAPFSLPGNPLRQLARLALRALDAQGLGAYELALRIGGASGEFAVLAVLLDKLRTALRAFFIEQFVGLQGSSRAGFQAPRGFAIRIAGACQEHAPAAALDDHLAPAVVAGFDFCGAIFALGRQLRREIADEIAVYSPRLGRMTEGHSPFAVSFAIPCGTPGLRFLCRESFDLGRSHFDHPLGSRFEEMDCVAIFNRVLIPWERVFLCGDAASTITGAALSIDGGWVAQ